MSDRDLVGALRAMLDAESYSRPMEEFVGGAVTPWREGSNVFHCSIHGTIHEPVCILCEVSYREHHRRERVMMHHERDAKLSAAAEVARAALAEAD